MCLHCFKVCEDLRQEMSYPLIKPQYTKSKFQIWYSVSFRRNGHFIERQSVKIEVLKIVRLELNLKQRHSYQILGKPRASFLVSTCDLTHPQLFMRRICSTKSSSSDFGLRLVVTCLLFPQIFIKSHG